MIFLMTESFKNLNNKFNLTHWHNDIEIIRILENSMSCTINAKDIILDKDDICIINTQQLHSIKQYNKDDCIFQRLIIDPKLFASNKKIYEMYVLPVLMDESFHHVLSKKGTRFKSDILNIIDGIYDLDNSKHPTYEMQIISLIYQLFSKLYLYYISEKNKYSEPLNKDIFIYRKMSGYIYENYQKKMTLEEISDVGHISKSKCINIFKEYTGHSPIDFLNLYRLKISLELLENTKQTIGEIALESGFEQQSYYNRLFQRQYSMTPSNYRKQFDKENTPVNL